MTTEIAIRERCAMCRGYGCVVIWVHYPPPKSMPGVYMNGPSMFGRTAVCRACYDRETARIKWVRASRKLRTGVAA